MRKQNQHTWYWLFIILLAAGNAGDVQAGAWTLPKGHIWTKLSFYSLITTDQYAEIPGIFPETGPFGVGDKVPFPFNGKSTSRAVFLDVNYGITDWWTLGVLVPFYSQEFTDNQVIDADRQQTGLSDILGTTKIRLLESPLVVSVIGQVKFPTGEFKNIDGVVPVGEGQMDIIAGLSMGLSLWPLPAYTNLDVGWRFRMENTEVQLDPGDEFHFIWEFGYDILPRVSTTLKISGLYGRFAKFRLSFVEPTRKRQILYISPEIGFRLTGDWIAGGGVNIPVQGRSYPAGKQFFLGLSTTFP